MDRKRWFSLALLMPLLVGVLALGCTPTAAAQVSFGVQIGGGPAPACPYGYYDYAPYNCSPYGYYGPEWFNNGLFLGAGPWWHGDRGFRGYVNRRYDPRFGYRGGFPGRGSVGYYHGGDIHGFSGNQYRTGQGIYRGGGGGFRGGGGYHGGGGGFHGGGGGFHGGGGGHSGGHGGGGHH